MSDIKKFITEHEDGIVASSDGVTWNQREIIEDVQRALAGKFKGGDMEPDGKTRKYFFNIGWILSRSCFYASDIDTKDMNLRGLSDQGRIIAPLLRAAISTHLRLTHFGKKIEEIRWRLITEGHVIAKIVDGEICLVDLRNIVRPASVKDLQSIDFVERRLVTYNDLLHYQWKIKGEYWDQIEKMREDGTQVFKVYEYWHRRFEGKSVEKWCEVYVDCSAYKPKDNDHATMWQPQIEIDEYRTPNKRKFKSERKRKQAGTEKEDVYPYVEARFIDVQGRWSGVGFFELVKGMVEQANMKWGVHHKKERADMGTFVYKKRSGEGQSLKQKVLSDLNPNALIEIAHDEDFQQLGIDTKLSDLLAVHDKLLDFARQLCGITGVASGETLPSSTTATTASIMQQNQRTTYDYVIEQMHHFLVELFQDFYIDVILDETTDKEIALIADKSTLQEIDNVMVEQTINAATKKLLVKPQPYEIETAKVEMLTELENQGDTRFITIKRKMVERIPYVVEFFVSNETFDKNAKLQNIMFLMNDQNFQGDRRKLYETFFDLIGEDPKQYKLYEGSAVQQGVGGVGGIAGAGAIGGGQAAPALP